MATAGRKPKHPGLEVLDGGRSKCAQPRTVEIPGEYPACPPDFDHPELWAELQSIFEENGTPIRSGDVFAIEELCSMIAEVRAMRKTLKGGRTTQGDRNRLYGLTRSSRSLSTREQPCGGPLSVLV